MNKQSHISELEALAGNKFNTHVEWECNVCGAEFEKPFIAVYESCEGVERVKKCTECASTDISKI